MKIAQMSVSCNANSVLQPERYLVHLQLPVPRNGATLTAAPVKEAADGRLLQLLCRHRLDVLENAVQPGRVRQVV